MQIDEENARRKSVQKLLEQNLEKKQIIQKQISAKTDQKIKISETIRTLEKDISKNEKELKYVVAEQLEKYDIQKNNNSDCRLTEIKDLVKNLKPNEKLEKSHIAEITIEEKFKKEWKANPYMATVHLYNATRRNEIPFSVEKKHLINQKREKSLNSLLEKILYTVPYKELINDTKHKDPEEIMVYFKKHNKKLERISKDYALFKEYIEYKRWSDINSHYYNLGQNRNIKDSSGKSGRQSNNIDNLNRNGKER